MFHTAASHFWKFLFLPPVSWVVTHNRLALQHKSRLEAGTRGLPLWPWVKLSVYTVSVLDIYCLARKKKIKHLGGKKGYIQVNHVQTRSCVIFSLIELLFTHFKQIFHLCLLGCIILALNKSAVAYNPKGSCFYKNKPGSLSSFQSLLPIMRHLPKTCIFESCPFLTQVGSLSCYLAIAVVFWELRGRIFLPPVSFMVRPVSGTQPHLTTQYFVQFPSRICCHFSCWARAAWS